MISKREVLIYFTTIIKTNISMRDFKLTKVFFIALLLVVPLCLWADDEKSTFSIPLNGLWEMGSGRDYNQKVIVPGIHTDATKMNPEKLWYRKEIILPEGVWKFATLELKGARFAPEVYVNRISVSKQNGGMAPTFHLLNQSDVKPGEKIVLEIALTSLKDLPSTDASYIPVADHWRSNISSSLWDDVVLKLHGDYRIDRIIPFIDFNNKKADISFDVSSFGSVTHKPIIAMVEVIDKTGKVLLHNKGNVSVSNNKIPIDYGNILQPWSPNQPNLYKLKVSIVEGNNIIDQSIISFGVRDFRIEDKQFYLNNQPITLLGGTTVWPRWMRDKEGQELGYNKEWFIDNVILRSKEHGANYHRFHLGLPPESFLDLCDEYGLAVQFEWSFFHGMPASKESLIEQYAKWIDLAMRHPSVVLIHPYNETEGDELDILWSALNEILRDYPPLVMEERDVIHIHKYWWGLFENLGLYYDSADQFPKAIMVDEFGGNYLDGDGMIGGYPTIPETYLRFLGRNHTKESRLAFHAMSNSKVAEYWRRIGASGVSPFCILGSHEDGNHWFMGKLKEGKPKPVWSELTCAWSPQSVSIELWDKNFVPGQVLNLPIYLFNDTPNKNRFEVKLSLRDNFGKIFKEEFLTYADIESFTTKVEHYNLILPFKTGKYIISAELLNRPEQVKYSIISQWEVNVFKTIVPEVLLQSEVSVSANEPEIIQFLNDNHIRHVSLSDTTAQIILLSKAGWEKISEHDQVLLDKIEKAINNGTSVILLDVGDRYLGQGYPKDKGDLGPLQGVVTKSNTPVKTYNLFGGIELSFNEVAEPESHIHPDKNNSALWDHIQLDYTWLWNGMRGGLIVPATNMEFAGLSSSAFLSQWLVNGADENKIKNDSYYAYELEGFYEFSNNPEDNELTRKLKEKISFLVEDAPALANSLNPRAPVKVTNISKAYKDSKNGMGESLTPLANAGKGLTRTPIVMISFGKGKGNLIVSQLLTSGRLASGYGEQGLYGIRYDEVAAQFVLNMMDLAISNK